MKTYSPLRYPGGKTIIRSYLIDYLRINPAIETFVEPYAGGAGLGLWLLENRKIKQLILNDKDEFIFNFWHSVLFETDSIVEMIREIPITIEEWDKQRQIIIKQETQINSTSLEIGFAALFLNRCNRSGIIRGDVGPIGGKRQISKWKIDVRFNKDRIIEKILNIKAKQDQITICNLDAISFIENLQRERIESRHYLYYLDPPYFKNGDTLYRSFYKEADHKDLFSFLYKNNALKWILSYDNAEFIKDLYSPFETHEIKVNHHAHKIKNGSELLIMSPEVKWPS